MIEWLLTALLSTAISGAVKKQQIKNNMVKYHRPVKYTRPPRYKNRGKQMMYEKYLRDKERNPECAEFCHQKRMYGGYIFDDTEN